MPVPKEINPYGVAGGNQVTYSNQGGSSTISRNAGNVSLLEQFKKTYGVKPTTPKVNMPSQAVNYVNRGMKKRPVQQAAEGVAAALPERTNTLSDFARRHLQKGVTPGLRWNGYKSPTTYINYGMKRDYPNAELIRLGYDGGKGKTPGYAGMGDLQLLEYYQKLFGENAGEGTPDTTTNNGGGGYGGYGYGGYGGYGSGYGSYRNPYNWYFSLLNWRI